MEYLELGRCLKNVRLYLNFTPKPIALLRMFLIGFKKHRFSHVKAFDFLFLAEFVFSLRKTKYAS